MAKYNVFIDTCVYYKEQFQFGKDKSLVMALLKNEVDLGNIELLLPIITMNEIKKYLLCDIEEYNVKIKNAIKKVFRDRPWFNQDSDNYNFLIYNQNLKEFSDFIKKYHCKILNYDTIDSSKVERVFEKYFNNDFPFENNQNKKNEFPDAFVVEMLKTVDSKKLIIVSDDNGLKKAFEDDQILMFDNIKSLLNFLIKENPKSKNAFYHLSIIMSKAKDIIIKQIDEKIKDYKVVIPHVDVLPYSDIKCFGEPYDAKIIDFDDNYLTFSVSINVTAEFECLNNKQEAELYMRGKAGEFIFKAKLMENNNYRLKIIKDDMFDCFFIDEI